MIKALAFVASCALAVASSAGAAFAWNIGPNSFEVLSYQGSDYKFLIIPPNATPPKGFEQPNFDDAAFKSGSAAFGSGGGCPLDSTVQTPWPVNSQLLVRRVILIPAGATQVQIRASVDNDIIGVFFNGTRVQGPLSHEGCATRDQVRIDVPQSLIQPGENLVAFQVVDRGVESFFNARILANIPPDQLSAAVAVQTPLAPVSNVAVVCSPPVKTQNASKLIATVRYLVDAIGATGRIEFLQLQDAPARFSTNVFLDNKLISSSATSFPSGPGIVNPSFDSIKHMPPANQLQALLASNSALARESVVTEVFGCIKRQMSVPQQQAAVG